MKNFRDLFIGALAGPVLAVFTACTVYGQSPAACSRVLESAFETPWKQGLVH